MIPLILVSAALLAADPATVEESITVTVVGSLRTSVVAIGGETTGTTVTANGITWELDFGKNASLQAAVEALNGKPVSVTGTWSAGLELRSKSAGLWLSRA